MDEDERHGAGIAVAPLGVERDARGNGHPQLGDRRPVRLMRSLSHGLSPGPRAMVVRPSPCAQALASAGAPAAQPPSALSMLWRTSGAEGDVGGAKRASTLPFRPTTNLAKFHLMSPGPSGCVACSVSQA